MAATICPRPVTLTFDLLTLKSVWESYVTWGTPVQSFVFLDLLVFELEPMYATSDGRTDNGRRWPPNAPDTKSRSFVRSLQSCRNYTLRPLMTVIISRSLPRWLVKPVRAVSTFSKPQLSATARPMSTKLGVYILRVVEQNVSEAEFWITTPASRGAAATPN